LPPDVITVDETSHGELISAATSLIVLFQR
jgi:hypothetical protein